jgi:hypothetical protein
MLVRCSITEIEKIASEKSRARLQGMIRLNGPIRDLVVGQCYRVHAIEYLDSGCCFFIHSVPQLEFPHPYPAELFEIVDSRVPAGWSVKFVADDDCVVLRRLSYREWALDDTFYERLIDGDPAATRMYGRWQSEV